MPKTIWHLNVAISEKSPPKYWEFGPFFPKNILEMSRSPIFIFGQQVVKCRPKRNC
jgi:hypothetical protein